MAEPAFDSHDDIAEPATARPAANPPQNAESEESIDDYMARLLNRVRGISGDQPATPKPAAAVTPQPLNRRRPRPRARKSDWPASPSLPLRPSDTPTCIEEPTNTRAIGCTLGGTRNGSEHCRNARTCQHDRAPCNQPPRKRAVGQIGDGQSFFGHHRHRLWAVADLAFHGGKPGTALQRSRGDHCRRLLARTGRGSGSKCSADGRPLQKGCRQELESRGQR